MIPFFPRNVPVGFPLRAGCGILLFILLFILIGPLLISHDYLTQNLAESLESPSASHWLGTDHYGRDIFTRLIYGGRLTWIIAVFATLIAVVIGTLVGLFSTWQGGWVDLILMRLVDVVLAFPRIFIILLIVGLGGSSIKLLIWLLALFSWMETARIVRAEVGIQKNLTYVKAARAAGLGTNRILFRHILPNIAGPVIVSAVLLISTIILVESSLSFLGLGVQPPNASWGTILNEGKIDPLGTWWISVPAGICILLTVIGFNLIGDALRDLFDPYHFKL